MIATTLQEQLAERLGHVRLSAFATVLKPGEHCSPGLTGLPALADASALTVAWSVHAPDGTPLEPGAAFVAPRGLSATRADLVFRPEVVEKLSAPAPALQRTVRATVTLTAPGKRGEPVSVSRVLEGQVQVLALAVPSLLALFRHREFAFHRPDERQEGAALLVAPASSPLASLAAVRGELTQLHAAVRALAGFARFATLARRLEKLTTALGQHPDAHVHYMRADKLDNLNQITLIQRGALRNDIEAEDELSSMILLGPANRRARCFIRRHQDPAGGRMDVTVQDDNIVLIPSLHAKSPATEPGGRTVIVIEPGGGKTFGDELSSLELVKPGFTAVLEGQATLKVAGPLGGSDTVPVAIGLAFTEDHRTLVVDSFPEIRGDAATITLVGETNGAYDPGTGGLALAVRLHLATALGPLEVSYVLTTASAAEGQFSGTGHGLNPDTGAIKLVAAARLEGSAVNPVAGQESLVTVDGTIKPIP
jgi:hypothetical protein